MNIPSTRGNQRAIDHFFISPCLLQYITRAGLAPKEVCFASDHIGLFLDLSPKILDTANNPIPPAPNRKLKMHNTPNVTKYVKAVLKQFECHNIIQRLKNLDKSIKEDGFADIYAMELERLDQHVTAIMLKAEHDLAFGNITRLGLPVEVANEDTETIWNYIQSKTQAEMKKGSVGVHRRSTHY